MCCLTWALSLNGVGVPSLLTISGVSRCFKETHLGHRLKASKVFSGRSRLIQTLFFTSLDSHYLWWPQMLSSIKFFAWGAWGQQRRVACTNVLGFAAQPFPRSSWLGTILGSAHNVSPQQIHKLNLIITRTFNRIRWPVRIGRHKKQLLLETRKACVESISLYICSGVSCKVQSLTGPPAGTEPLTNCSISSSAKTSKSICWSQCSEALWYKSSGSTPTWTGRALYKKPHKTERSQIVTKRQMRNKPIYIYNIKQ